MNDELTRTKTYLNEAERAIKAGHWTNAAIYLNNLTLSINALRIFTRNEGVRVAREAADATSAR